MEIVEEAQEEARQNVVVEEVKEEAGQMEIVEVLAEPARGRTYDRVRQQLRLGGPGHGRPNPSCPRLPPSPLPSTAKPARDCTHG